MPSDAFAGPPAAFIVVFVVVALLIVLGIVRAAIAVGRGSSVGGPAPMAGDLGAREHQRVVDQQIVQQGMTGAPAETGGMHGGHHHVDHTPPPPPPAP